MSDVDLDALQLGVEELVELVVGRRPTCPVPWSSDAADPVADVWAMRALVENGSRVEIVRQDGAGPYCGECGVPVCEHVLRAIS